MSDASQIHTNDTSVEPILDDETQTGDQPVTNGVDPRHLRRMSLMQALFAVSFAQTPADQQDQLAEHPDLVELLAGVDELDSSIQVLAPERPLKDINKVDLAILRLIVFESKHHKTPKKVLINEAVELAKEFGTESSPRFVNGVLAQLFEMDQTSHDETETTTESSTTS
jgi:N utilization substance protein B